MKCLVAIKQVIDPYFTIRVKADNSGVETNNVKLAMNPFDEIAIEEAVRLKEQGVVQEIIAVSIGNKNVQETLRQALARGADQALLVETDKELMPLNVAKCLKVIVEQQQPQLVILGKQAIDNDCNQTGQMLAALLGWSQGTFISKVMMVEKGMLRVVREVDGGLESLHLRSPAVLTTDLRLNEPRYISLPNVMQAKRKPLHIKPIAELGVELRESLQVVRVDAPPKREAGKILSSVQELVAVLKAKGF